MTIPLTPSSLTRLRPLVPAKWGACAEAQGCVGVRAGTIDVSPDGFLFLILRYLPAPETSYALERATESLSRILEDEGYDVERGERDGRPTWRVVGIASEEQRTPGHPDYDHRNAWLWAQRQRADAPRHAAASDPRGPKYEHAVRVGKMAERSKAR